MTDAQLWPNYPEPGPDIHGDFCTVRRGGCCPGRDDQCTMRILDTVCYCDEFCARSQSDCCPDYSQICLGIKPEPTKIRSKIPFLIILFKHKCYDKFSCDNFWENADTCVSWYISMSRITNDRSELSFLLSVWSTSWSLKKKGPRMKSTPLNISRVSTIKKPTVMFLEMSSKKEEGVRKT
jgi:hypothetical protein